MSPRSKRPAQEPAARPEVLLVDDDEDILLLLVKVLGEAGVKTTTATSLGEARARFAERDPSVWSGAVLDLNLPDGTGADLLREFLARRRSLPVVMLTVQDSVDVVVECMLAGARDYVPKPFDPTLLLDRLESSFRFEAPSDVTLLECHSPAMQSCSALLERAASTSSPVLIEGEPGVGKGHVARALHARCRPHGALVVLNCRATPPEEIEVELLGDRSRPGRLALAQGGTLLLDDVDSLSTQGQTVLQQFLNEEGSFDGGARLVSVSETPLRELVAAGNFRPDLYYGLAVFRFVVPPLRERREDVAALSNRLLAAAVERHGRSAKTRFSSDALAILAEHDWPGNVSELEAAVERGVILATGTKVDLELLPPPLPVGVHIGLESSDGITPLDDVERAHIQRALEVTGWNMREAARRLGIGRATIYRKVARYGLRGE